MKWRHFPLHPDTPPEGQTLEALFAGRNVDIQANQVRMRRLMEEEGLPYGKRTHTFNSRLSQELGAWAETLPHGDAIHDALFQAYFVDGKNIGDVSTLLEIVADIGLSVDEGHEVLQTRRFKQAVDADWERARMLGITGVPTFVADGRGVVGAQPYESLEHLVVLAGATKRLASE